MYPQRTFSYPGLKAILILLGFVILSSLSFASQYALPLTWQEYAAQAAPGNAEDATEEPDTLVSIVHCLVEERNESKTHRRRTAERAYKGALPAQQTSGSVAGAGLRTFSERPAYYNFLFRYTPF